MERAQSATVAYDIVSQPPKIPLLCIREYQRRQDCLKAIDVWIGEAGVHQGSRKAKIFTLFCRWLVVVGIVWVAEGC